MENRIQWMVTEKIGEHPVFGIKILVVGTFQECFKLWHNIRKSGNNHVQNYKILRARLPD